ncbi:DUF6012 family protein [Pseudomonas asiatica]|uniref:DUF6012 family protein n=1 Tax=Pseudomonas asiatica TaxID=2219225 RepID=UPI00345CA4B9
MLIHVTPKILTGKDHHRVDVSLVDVSIPDFGLTLRGGVDIVGRKPYPNKYYTVACRKVGREAVVGLLLDVDRQVRDFTITTRWALVADVVVKHVVKYEILDEEYDAATDCMLIWSGFMGDGTQFQNRWPESAKEFVPASHQPRMDVLAGCGKKGDFKDTQTPYGIILERHESIQIPTVERERLVRRASSINNRLPHFEHAIRL